MKAVIKGYYGVGNLGDDYLLYSILSSLLNQGINEVTVFTYGDCIQDYSLEFPGIRYIKLSGNIANQLFQMKNELSNTDLYILGGGGLFPNDTVRSYLKVLLEVICCKIIGVRSIQFYGIDLCSLRDRFSKIIWRYIVNYLTRCNFRNVYSYDLIANIANKDNICFGPDITFSYVSPIEKNNNELCEMLHSLKLHENQYAIWVLAKPWSDAELLIGKNLDRYNKLCTQIAEICNKSNCINVFLPFFHNSDIDMIRKVTRMVNNQYMIIDEKSVRTNCKRALFKYARFAVSMRFHGIAFSLYHGTPVLGIAYSPKSERLMKDCDLEDYLIDFGISAKSGFFKEFDMDDEELLDKFSSLVNLKDNSVFKEKSVELRNKAKSNEKGMLDSIII